MPRPHRDLFLVSFLILFVELAAIRWFPATVYFGTEYRPADPSRVIVPMRVAGGVFFALISAAFVGLGQAWR